MVNISIAVLAIPAGYLIDRWSRTKMMGIMTFVWSMATGACALAGSFGHLFIARFFVGAGEAGYSPAAQSLLAASFPARLRTTVMSMFMFAASLGTPLGLMAGALIAQHWGWRHALGMVALPGILAAGLCLLMKDYKNVKPAYPAPADLQTARRNSWLGTVLGVLAAPSLVCVFLAQALKLSFSATMMNWLPSYFHRMAGTEVATASFISAAFLIAHAASPLVCGPFLDWLRACSPLWAIRWQALACFVASGLFACAFGLAEPGGAVQIGLLLIMNFFTASLVPLGYTLTADLSLPHQQGTAISLLVTTQNIFGMAVGPLLAGAVSDHFNPGVSLIVMSGFVALAGALYMGVSVFYNRDLARLDKVVVEF